VPRTNMGRGGSLSEDADIDDFTADGQGSFRAESSPRAATRCTRRASCRQALDNLDQASKLCSTCSAPYRDQALVSMRSLATEAAAAAIAPSPVIHVRAPLCVRGIIKARAGRRSRRSATTTRRSGSRRRSPVPSKPVRARTTDWAAARRRRRCQRGRPARAGGPQRWLSRSPMRARTGAGSAGLGERRFENVFRPQLAGPPGPWLVT